MHKLSTISESSLFGYMKQNLIKKTSQVECLEFCESMITKLNKFCDELEAKDEEKYANVLECLTCAVECLADISDGKKTKFEIKVIKDSDELEEEVQEEIEEQSK